MNNYLQALVSTIAILSGVSVSLFYSFFKKVSDLDQEAFIGQNTGELRRTGFSQTTRILNYVYITLITIFLLVVYFLVPQQRL